MSLVFVWYLNVAVFMQTVEGLMIYKYLIWG